MIIQAELRRKQSEYEGEPCAVDKVIELPSQRFQQFSRALLADYDFIAENKNAIRHDEDADTACSSSTRRERTVSLLTHRGTTTPGTAPLSPTPAVC